MARATVNLPDGVRFGRVVPIPADPADRSDYIVQALANRHLVIVDEPQPEPAEEPAEEPAVEAPAPAALPGWGRYRAGE